MLIKGIKQWLPLLTKGGEQRLPLLTKGSCPSAHTGAEGIRTAVFPGILNSRNFTIPQSKIEDFCQQYIVV